MRRALTTGLGALVWLAAAVASGDQVDAGAVSSHPAGVGKQAAPSAATTQTAPPAPTTPAAPIAPKPAAAPVNTPAAPIAPKPAAKPAVKPAAKPPATPPVTLKAPVAPGKPPIKVATRTQPRAGQQEEGTRRSVAGGPTAAEVTLGAESPELRALREAEREAFPYAMPQVGTHWPSELPSPLIQASDAPVVHASGAPFSRSTPAAAPAEGGRDISWLSGLEMPDLPVRFEPRVVRYLELYKNDPRARAAIAVWLKRSGRYRALIESILQKKSMPRDLVWLAMIESGFDPAIRSPAGAVGMWQFMPETGKSYGLPQDRWVDERMNVELATGAAADFLSDLHRRFSSWELALASYNMGYGGMVSALRKYNTNDFWALTQTEGSLPWETTLYVPKILAAAVVAHNLKVFGLEGLVPDAAVSFERVPVPFAMPLALLAQAGGTTAKELEQLNPELRASRTPPKDSEVAGAAGAETSYSLRVPAGRAAAMALGAAKLKTDDAALERYIVRFGESLEQIAQARGTTVDKLVAINAIATGEAVRGGATLLVPHARTPATAATATRADKPVVVVPSALFVYPDRKRVFYKVLLGDSLGGIAQALHVPVEDLVKWNEIDPSARLVEAMTVQAFVPKELDLSKVVLLSESEVRPLTIGTEEFFTFFESAKGRRRHVVRARHGETVEGLGKRYGVSAGLMERINRRSRHDALGDNEAVVIYVPAEKVISPLDAARPSAAVPVQAPASAPSDAPTPAAASDAPAPEPLPALPLDPP